MVRPPSSPIDRKDIARRTFKILLEQMQIEEHRFPGPRSSRLHLINDLGLDELDMVEMIMECEEEFQISIPDELIEYIETLGELVDLIIYRMNPKGKLPDVLKKQISDDVQYVNEPYIELEPYYNVPMIVSAFIFLFMIVVFVILQVWQ